MEHQTIQSVDDEIPVYNLEYGKQGPLPQTGPTAHAPDISSSSRFSPCDVSRSRIKLTYKYFTRRRIL
jgi:hypothetical protein